VSRYVTEFIGTFFLVLAIGFTAVSGTAHAPLAIGSMLMVMLYLGGHVSGGHYNPAVTIGVRMRGGMDPADVLPYFVAQILGAIVAGLMVFAVTGSTFAPAPAQGAGVFAVLLCEAVLTFALVLVVLNVATHPATEGNSYFGLAIGFTVAAGAYSVGPISGGAFNPAVGIGPILVDALAGGGSWGALWFYLVGPIVGGMAAVPVFRMQLGDAEA
jgi:aquaporin Z